jgi:hypothetical protein
VLTDGGLQDNLSIATMLFPIPGASPSGFSRLCRFHMALKITKTLYRRLPVSDGDGFSRLCRFHMALKITKTLYRRLPVSNGDVL